MARQVRRGQLEGSRVGRRITRMTATALLEDISAQIETAGPPRHGDRVARWLRIITEYPAAAAVVAEVVILFVGILARGVFHSPIIWSDELASILFLWLAMLGSAIAV